MPEALRSQVRIREENPQLRSLPALPTAVGAMLGVSERGPLRTPVRVTSYDDFAGIFGGFITAGVAAEQVRAAFLEGLRELWFSRVVHYTDVTNAATFTATRGSLALNTGATAPGAAVVTGTVVGPWDFRLQGAPIDLQATFGPGGGADLTRTATITATAASRDSVAGTFNFTGVLPGTLTVAINGGAVQTITLAASDFANVAAATAAEVAAAINRQLLGGSASVVGTAARVSSDQRGTGSGVNVTGGTANGVLGYTLGNVAGTGNVANLGAVQFTELETIIETALNAAPLGTNLGVNVVNNGGRLEIRTVDVGVAAHVQVLAASTTDDELGLDNVDHTGTSGAAVGTLRVDAKWPGSYSGGLQVAIVAATNGAADRFNLELYEDGALVQTWHNATMDTAHRDYIVTLVGGVATARQGTTELITAVDLAAAGTTTQRRPANAVVASLTAGNDGLAGLVDADFTGDRSAGTGIHAFGATSGIRAVAAPDRPTATVQNALTTYCAVNRQGTAVAILDPPAGLTGAGIVAYAATLTASEFGYLVWPRITIPNPSTAIFGTGDTITIAPSGSVLGRWARNDATRPEGPFGQPANQEWGQLIGAVGLETDTVERDEVRDLLAGALVNPIRRSGGNVYVDDTMMLLATGQFPSIGERRGMADVIARVQAGLEALRNQNNDAQLRARMQRLIRAFLLGRTRDGAFASNDPDVAFFVDVGEALNPPSVTDRGIARVRVGVFTGRPARLIDVLISRDSRAAEEAAAA